MLRAQRESGIMVPGKGHRNSPCGLHHFSIRYETKPSFKMNSHNNVSKILSLTEGERAGLSLVEDMRMTYQNNHIKRDSSVMIWPGCLPPG